MFLLDHSLVWRDCGVMKAVALSGKIKSIEDWASVSPERERLLIVLVCVGMGVLALIAIGIVALVISPPAIPR
jgi:hypothetical protein